MKKAAWRGWLSLLAALLLGGCYETEKPVLERGAPGPLAGRFVCLEGARQRPVEYLFVEERQGAGYRYVDQEGTATSLQPLASGLVLAQAVGPSSTYSIYAYIDFVDERHFNVLTVDFARQGSQVLRLLQTHGVEGKGSDDVWRLQGEPSRIAAFLADHERSLLQVNSRCERSAP